MLNNVDKQYHNLLEDIMKNGHQKGDRTGTGTKSVFGRQIRFNMREGFPLLTTKKLHLRSITHELLWFLKGDTNIKYLNDNGVTIWDEWADGDGELGPVYGKQWVDWQGFEEGWNTAAVYSDYSQDSDEIKNLKNGNTSVKSLKEQHKGVNQIQNLIDRLQTHPDCRRLIVSAWNVGELDHMALMPCHNFFQVWTRELCTEERNEYIKKNWLHEGGLDEMSLDQQNAPKREISLMWNQRSVDTFLGLPFNIASYGLLLEMISQQTNMVAGELIGTLGDTHLYSNHIEYVEKQLQRESKDCDIKLVLNKADSIFDYKFEDFKIEGYEAHPNWKNVPIAV